MARLFRAAIVCFVGLGGPLLFSQSVIPPEAGGWADVTNALAGAFDHVDVIVLGEAHGRKPDADLRVALVRNPRFAAAVPVIVLEAPQPELSAAVEAINQGVPPSRRIQVFLNQTPQGGDRNATAVALVREQALATGRKALVVFGSGHVWRGFGGVTRLLEQGIPGRVLVVETIAPVGPAGSTPETAARFATSSRELEATLRGGQWPALVALRGSAAGMLEADPFYLGQAMLGAQVRLGDLADAVVYFGSVR